MTLQTLSPKRIEIIDVLRGFALFGIAIIHMIEQYYAGQPPEQFAQPQTIADGITQGFGFIFIMGKFFMIFSFLFGLSFYIQFSKSDAENNFLIRFAWRLLILFGIGMLHHLHYRGDILTIYAVLGFALLLFYKLPDRYLLILALILVFNIPSLVTRSIQIFYPGESEIQQDPRAVMAYYETVKNGSYIEILKANLAGFIDKFNFQVWSGRIYITLGLFLLGIYAGRKKFFENLTEYMPVTKKLRRIAFWSVGGCILFSSVFFGGANAAGLKLNNQLNMAVGGFIYDIFNSALFVIYICTIIVLFQKPNWKKRLMIFFPVGKMGLTIYLLQAFIGTMIFFSYGLGLLYELGAFYSLLLALVSFALQVVIAHTWFKYFAYGPIEWLWRNLTYFKIQKLVLSKSTGIA
jgi:uncharacterized protein